jgi:hypothetical protein
VLNLHGVDVNSVINALRLILDGFKFYGQKGEGDKESDKREKVLKETVEKAEEMSAGGATTDQVVQDIETRLERELGANAKTEIINRASSILALAQPFEIESFRYYDNLTLILDRAREFCKAANIFKLRGTTDRAFEYLELPRLSKVLPEICGTFKFLMDQFIVGDTFRVLPAKITVILSTKAVGLLIWFDLELEKAYQIGGSYIDKENAYLSISKGTGVNRIAFDVLAPQYKRGGEIRLTGKEFQVIVSAIFEDLNNYVRELSEEQMEFKERVGPALTAILTAWMKP